jgi:hypothetical protein
MHKNLTKGATGEQYTQAYPSQTHEWISVISTHSPAQTQYHREMADSIDVPWSMVEMKILRSVRHKICADGTLMKEFLLDTPISEEFFSYLKNFGSVTSLPNLGEGFYKFEKQDWFSIKGFSGDTLVEVRFKKEVINLTYDFLYLLFSWYWDTKPDIPRLKEREKVTAEQVRRYLYGPEETKTKIKNTEHWS